MIKLGVIFGGMSTEHDISVVSAGSIIKNLNKRKYEIYPIYISKKGEWYHYTKDANNIEVFKVGEEPKELEKIKNEIKALKDLDIIFPVLHGLYGEDGTIQGLLEIAKKPYVGCKVLASGICMDKVYAKIIFGKAGINQADYMVLKTSKQGYIYVDQNLNETLKDIKQISCMVEEKLKYPVFVKPSNSGSSVGISKATNQEELIKAVELAEKYDKEIIIEKEIIGKEVECAVLETDKIEASCVGQILSADEFYSYNAKYENAESKTRIPADIKQETSELIRKLAIKAFKAVGGRGLSRVDFFVEKNTGKVYINEINTMPGFTTISMYPQLWESCGLSYEKLLDKLIENV